MNSRRDNGIAVLALVGVAALSFGIGGAYGWPFGLMAVGAFAIFISWAAA